MPSLPTTKNLTTEDRALIKKLVGKGWWTLLRTYGAFFLALIYLYYRMYPGTSFRGHSYKMSGSDYLHIYEIVALFFGSVFLYFTIRDYRRLVLPLQKDLARGECFCCSFLARKYDDPVYGKHLLFFPDKEDWYIDLSQDDFNSIANGEELSLYTAAVSGEVLTLSVGERPLTSATLFSFKDMPTPRLFKNYDTYD